MDSNHVEGNVLGTSVQAGVIQGDVHFHVAEKSAQPERPPLALVEGWHALPELPAELRSLAEAQVQAAHTLPYRLTGSRRPSLATVYVRQDLGGGTEEQQRTEAARPTPVLDGHGRLVEVLRAPTVRVAVRPPVRTVRDVLDSDEHLVVTGGAGQGKSTLSLRLASDIAGRWCGDSGDEVVAEPVMALRVTARELAARLDLPFAQALADSAYAEYGALLRARPSPDLLGDRVAGCRWLLLVDALDEVATTRDRDRLAEVLAAWASRTDSPYRVVVTTRPVEDATLAPLRRIKAARYELQPFDDQALRRFAENWFEEEGVHLAHRFVRQIRAAHLDELVRVPLLATIAAIVFQQQRERPLPDNQYALYEAYLAFLRSARTTTSPFEEHRETLLEHLARARVETDGSLVEAAQAWVRRTLRPEDLPRDWTQELTGYLASVGPLVNRNGDLRFLHHSFAEHLAATAQARLLPERFDPDHEEFARLLYAARPKGRGEYARSVLLHFTRLRPEEADPLVCQLHAGGAQQHLLAARLLARRVPASPEVLDAFLATVWEWAMTTTQPGQKILSQASRATQHSGLVKWLVELMRTERAPWQSRTEAASALATRQFGKSSSEAVGYLSGVVDDAEASVSQRLSAAEALAECGTDEQVAAERGLRAVLANPLASGFQCRTAAVVLASFGGDARRAAIEALSALLNEGSPTKDLVEAATGLIEIGPEFHDRSAEVFRLVLRDQVLSTAGRRDAALGLASLGPDHAAEAVSIVTALLADLRYSRSDRIEVAGVLGEIGPQHRGTAVGHVESIIAEPGVMDHEKWSGATRIAEFGLDFRDVAVRHFRSIVAHPRTRAIYVAWSAKSLADQAPEYVGEAVVELRRLLDENKSDGDLRVQVLDRLVDLGEPHRSAAMRHLRDIAGDSAELSNCRIQAAEKLARANPEFQAEARLRLVELAESGQNAATALAAWRALLRLGGSAVADALSAFLEMVALSDQEDGSFFVNVESFISSDVEHHLVAEVLTSVMMDPSRSLRSRIPAASRLIGLGRHHHPAVTAWACGLVRSIQVPDFDFPYMAGLFVTVGVGARAQLAEALRDALSAPGGGATRAWRLCSALDSLGHGSHSEVTAVLRDLMDDESVGTGVRIDSAVMLVAHGVDYVPAAERLALHILRNTDFGESHYFSWVFHRLGSEVAPRLWNIAADPDEGGDVRCSAAAALAFLSPSHRLLGLAEMRRQVDDVHRGGWPRGKIRLALADLDPDFREQSVAFFQAKVDDEREQVTLRMDAAGRLASLDQAKRDFALAVLRRFADDDRLSPGDRVYAVECMIKLQPGRAQDLAPIIALLAHRHIAPASVGTAIERLDRRTRTEIERDLLSDGSEPISRRVPEADVWDDNPLAEEAEKVVRAVLVAPETPPRRRAMAAVALARLSLLHVPDAVRVLEAFAWGEPAAVLARNELSSMGKRHFHRVLAEAADFVGDDARPMRERCRRAFFACDLTTVLPGQVIEFLRRVIADERMPERDRLTALYEFRRTGGLDGVRSVRDSERWSPVTRVTAAVHLAGYDVADRDTGARLLGTLATDCSRHPALRLFAARNLDQFGGAGKNRAAGALRVIMADGSASTFVRAEAAQLLLTWSPGDRHSVLKALRDLLKAARPLHRVDVLKVIGDVDLHSAVDGLERMMADRQLGAVVRVRCAEVVVSLRRHDRDRATAVLREVATDAVVPAHVRRRAARQWAQWSELCRAEARSVLATLTR